MKRKFSDWISVVGAREHNLKNVSVAIPKNALTVITGPSGSGKSSLALDVLYTEGKRRYVESLSSYARQFLGVSGKPAVDRIDGLCPAIAIDQKTVGANPRSTVGTITEIYDYLRVLFARIGKIHCPSCKATITAQSPETVACMVLERMQGSTVIVTAPLAHEKKGEFIVLLKRLFAQGFYQFFIDGMRHRFAAEQDIMALKLSKTHKHSIELIVDALEVTHDDQTRLHEAIERAFSLGKGLCTIVIGDQRVTYSSSRMCVGCAISVPEVEPRLFSFNSPIGACAECHGLGSINEWPWDSKDPQSWKERYPDFFGPKYATTHVCRSCHGNRLNPQALAITIGGKNIIELTSMPMDTLLHFLQTVVLDATERTIAHELWLEITNRLIFLVDVGLAYLSLNRSARTLSGGEGQRIRLATQIGSALSGVLYVLDEPSIGLHQRDNDRLLVTLKKLRDNGNTVVVVEHDMDTMKQSDYLIDMGPAAGVLGGQVTAYGTPEQVERNPASLTGAFLSGRRAISVPTVRRKPQKFMTLHHAKANNLRDLTVQIPLGVVCGISGVSGSGKSSLIMHELVPALERDLSSRYKQTDERLVAGSHHLSAMVVIDQTPIGRTPRSNPATYLGIFDEIRALFARLPESKARGYSVGRFSFNTAAGRCYECSGDGIIQVSMHFLPDVTMVCKSCQGQRYNAETLAIQYKGKNIAQVLAMSAYQAVEFFAAHARLIKRLQLVCDVGLDYLTLGQPSTTLSGGEAQRIKLVEELAKRGTDTLYILDEPTTGLHSTDVEKLLRVLTTLVDKGNSMIVIEHNLDVLKTVDYLIDLGPEGGNGGGTIVAQGTPEMVAQSPTSHTGRYLKYIL